VVCSNSREATVIGNYVYIDGGELSQVLDGNPPNKQNYASNSGQTTPWMVNRAMLCGRPAVLTVLDVPSQLDALH